MALADVVAKIGADVDALSGTVTEVVAEIADLKTKIVDQGTIDALQAIETKLANANAQLKSGE